MTVPKYRTAPPSKGAPTAGEVFFGRNLEQVPTRTYSELGKRFYNRPYVGEA